MNLVSVERDTAQEQNDFIASPLVFPGWLGAAECEMLRALGEQSGLEAAGLVVPKEGYREGMVGWISPTGVPRALLCKIHEAIHTANRWYKFDISRLEPALQYARYSVGHHANWHTDCGLGPTSTRKLSLTVQLSALEQYEGGGLEFSPGGELPLSRNIGCIIAFPSYLTHRVTPICRGTRSSLVIWAHGPAFR